jgi:DNA-binding helix-hairpin-helix protein with protein kinase domain
MASWKPTASDFLNLHVADCVIGRFIGNWAGLLHTNNQSLCPACAGERETSFGAGGEQAASATKQVAQKSVALVTIAPFLMWINLWCWFESVPLGLSVGNRRISNADF